MSTSKYINQVCVVGDQRKFLSAIVTLDEDNIKAYAAEKGITYGDSEELLYHDDVVRLIDEEVALKNKDLPSFETLKKVIIVPEFTIENKMMTPTFKVKKNVIMDNYQEKIENIYQ